MYYAAVLMKIPVPQVNLQHKSWSTEFTEDLHPWLVLAQLCPTVLSSLWMILGPILPQQDKFWGFGGPHWFS